MTHVKRLAIIAIFAILATACSVQKPISTKQSSSQIKDDKIRAENLILQAQNATTNRSIELKIEAATILYQLGDFTQSASILDSIVSTELTTQILFDLSILKAKNAIAQGQTQSVISYLQPIADDSIFSAEQNSEKYQLTATAHGILLENLQQIQAQISASQFVSERTAALALNENIWQTLQSLSDQQLLTLSEPDTNSYTVRGWGKLISSLRANPGFEKLQANIWLRSWSAHSAAKLPPFMLSTYLEKEPLVNKPYSFNHVVIALPQSGKFAKAGNAIRDGIKLAAAANNEIKISYIDTANISSAADILSQATQLQADMIIGPLNKALVGQLAQFGNLSIPTLALNHTVIGAGNLYQISLSSEGEARDAAVKAYNDGRRSMLVLTSDDTKGELAANAFSQQFNALGGQVLSTNRYNTQEGNLTDTIAQMLQISQSRVRALQKKMKTAQLRGVIRRMRRKDADGIFLMASLADAIQIGPSISYFYASDLPLYATSKIYSGRSNPTRDIDLNGMMFGDLPWVLAPPSVSKTTLAATHKNTSTRFGRLYALGIDAMNVAPELYQLSNQALSSYSGETGLLKVTSDNQVERSQHWARFVKGTPELLTEQP